MEDELLADDGQFKDDGLDELDIDEEAALLGLSDEEIERGADQELEYVDEDGNPVEIGENNAELYEVANIDSDKLITPTEDDVLELDLDAEIESFTRENPELLLREPIKTFKERQCKDNLISLTSRNKRDKPTIRRTESRHSPERGTNRTKAELSFSNQSSRNVPANSFSDKAEYDEESEDEGVADDHRERFKSERSNIITLTPAKKRDIPDTLESVINVEETAKVQAFLENEQKRKMRYKGKGSPRMKPPVRYSRPTQSFPHMQQHQQPQFSSPNSVHQSYQAPPVPAPAQPRKILINPHFRGVRLPPPATAEPVMTINQAPQVSVPPTSYNTSPNFVPSVYSHQDNTHQVNVAPPVFNSPPPAMPYKPPEYPPHQQHIQQAPPPIWQPPPEMPPPPVSYAAPPPPMNYGEPLAPVPGYHNTYNPNNFQNTTYSAPQMPPPQPMNYNQPPPPIHLHTPSYTPAPVTSVQTNVTHMHFQASQPRQQQNIQQNTYQNQRNVPRPPAPHIQRKNISQNQCFNRQPEKRPSNVNIKHVPAKLPRLEHPQRKNVHVNNSNIREIPLVDTLPTTQKIVYKTPAVVEEEDEKTKELRKKIEEQKLLREQILKRKEERRRQMASQRLMELKQRQAEQNKNVISIQRVEQNVIVKALVQPAKVSVKQRIGLPMSKIGPPTKKKIVVVRKKAIIPPSNTGVPIQQNKITGVLQRIGNLAVRQPQKIQLQKKPVGNPVANQKVQLKPKSQVVPATQQKQPLPQQKINQPNKTLATTAAKKIINKITTNPNIKQTNVSQQKQKGKIQQRLGNRRNFQRPPFQQPRSQNQQGLRLQLPPSPGFNGPRAPLFQDPSFMGNRMRFPHPGPPMNDMRMPNPPFQNQRPPLFQDQRPPPFQDKRGPHFQDQRGSPFQDQRPPRFQDQRLPPFQDQRGPPFQDQRPPPFQERPPPFQEQRPPLLSFHGPGERAPFMFESNHPRFRMQGPGFRDFGPNRMEMFPERFPRTQFPNQMQPMRQQMFEPNGPVFQRPHFHGSNSRQRPNVHNNQQKKAAIINKNTVTKTSTTASDNEKSVAKPEITNAVKDEGTKVTITKPQNLAQQQSSPANLNADSVSVENLSSSTSELQLKKLCSAVGVVENIELIKDQRKAVIKFKEPAQALNFQKKYQRYMLDLAMIQVSLIST